jgi:asparaginyl-tRNA synthetase
LLFPPIIKDAFGGEVVGSGQRQDNVEEMHESLKRQKNISSRSYAWYIDLRRQPNYTITSGFGLGVERFIAWALAKDDIKKVIPYPRLKNTVTFP